LGTLQDVHVVARDASGRARSFELVADRGSTAVRGSTFRLAVGARTLRSLLVTDVHKDPAGNAIVFAGGGLGHGVGLCQWGARGMALTGAAAAAILAVYFPGASVENYGR
jgi:stage II sporulation protein D